MTECFLYIYICYYKYSYNISRENYMQTYKWTKIWTFVYVSEQLFSPQVQWGNRSSGTMQREQKPRGQWEEMYRSQTMFFGKTFAFLVFLSVAESSLLCFNWGEGKWPRYSWPSKENMAALWKDMCSEGPECCEKLVAKHLTVTRWESWKIWF